MPTYEYKCKKCGDEFELWQEVGADAPACPECGAETQKIFRPTPIIFKGSGFYLTDTRNSSHQANSASNSESSSSKTTKTNDAAKASSS